MMLDGLEASDSEWRSFAKPFLRRCTAFLGRACGCGREICRSTSNAAENGGIFNFWGGINFMYDYYFNLYGILNDTPCFLVDIYQVRKVHNRRKCRRKRYGC